MNELITTNHNEQGEIIVSGRELHEFLGVKTAYKDWFPRMLNYGFEENIDFITIAQKRAVANGGYKMVDDHHLKLDMSKEIAMIQRTDKGKQARQYFLHLEKMWNSPEMVMKRALEYADKQIAEMKSKLELNKPKVLFAEALETSNTSILVGELAKLLKQNGISIGQNRLFDWLRDNGYLIKRNGETYNLPTQYSMENEWFEIKKRQINNPDGSVRVTKTPKVTGKGQIYFINKFLEEKEA
ncbi:phage antirepressor KilAC domain-containing protein [Rossellomorea aquimaris]|uniref:phage antirepressor KilAC domain-containing protein n=1 Tax=Rossellomorea aquimaris TaxID=189382 RepID=UPI0011E8DB3A|nr:phage antirepressor KilAC domain-containing protein [Rossellomorea aquimaris]TYS91930.1 oxidoreductase [Rossellomorea aquimaris]